jgi:integrase/recombinase XerD
LDYALTTLFMNLGLTIGELCRLKIGDLELSANLPVTLCVHREQSESRIKLPLNEVARSALAEWLKFRPDRPEEDSLLISDKGNGVTPNSVQRRFAILGRRVGLKITPHVLRRTCIKNLIDAGVSIYDVSEMVGVSSFNYFREYFDPRPPNFSQTVQALEAKWKENS